jgi:hypothetical protein
MDQDKVSSKTTKNAWDFEQDRVNKTSSSPVKNVWDEDSGRRKPMQQIKRKPSLGERWSAARPKKTLVFWSWVGFIVLTMIVGFGWGGWVTGGSARTMADTWSKAAVVQRLTPICVAQFNQDAAKDQKLAVLKDTDSWKRSDYVQKQGWATMPGEAKPDSLVAEACAKLLVPTSQ